MAGDKFDQLYNALKADGAVSGTREHFRQFVYAPGKQGYHNRKQLYDALHADGAVSSNSYEEFAQRLGLHAVNPKPQQKTKPVVQQPVQPVKKLTMKQRAQEVASQYQQSKQRRVQQPRTAPASGTDYMQNWRLMHMRNDQMNPMQQAQASNARARMQRAQEQSARQEQQRATPISRSRITPTAKNFNETMQQLSTPEARQARAKQQREDDARTLAQYEVEGNKFVRNDGQSEGILGNDLLKLVDSSMNEAQELTRQQYQQNLDKMGGIYAPQSVKEQAFRDAQTQEQVNRQNVLMNNLSKKISEIYSQKGMQRHIAESAERLNMGVEEYVDKYVTPEIMNYAQKALTMRNQEEIMPHGALDYIAKNLSNSIIGMVLAPSVMSRDTRQRLQEGIAIADGDAEIQKVAGHKDETYRSGIGTRFASTAVNMAADSGPLAIIGAGVSAAVNAGTRVLTNGLVKAGVMKAAQKLTAQQMAFKVANMTTAQKIMSGLGTRTATGALNLAGYSGVTAALSQASTGDDTSLQAIGEAGLKGAEHGAVTGAMFGVSGAVMAPWVSKFGITGLEKSTGERLLHGAQKFGATAAGLGVEAGTMMVADNVTGDKDISFGTWLEDVVMVGAFKAGEPSNFVKMGNILHHLTHNSGGNFVIGKNANGSPIAVDIRLTPDEKNELISSASGKNLMDAFVKVDRASKTAPRDPKYKTAYTDFMNDPDVSQSTKEKVNAAMGLFNTTRGRSYRSVNDVKNKQVLEYTKNGTLLTRTSYKNADECRAILYKQKLYRDNDDMLSLIGYSKMKDMQLTDEEGAVTSLAFGFLKKNGYDENKDITDPKNAQLINDLRNPKSALYLDWEKYVDKNGLYGYLKEGTTEVAGGFLNAMKEIINDNGQMIVDIDKIIQKDPMKRTDKENEIFYHVKRALEDDLFPSGKPHADQSASQGKTVAEENKLGTDNPEGDVVVDELRNLHNAEQAVDEAMESNDVFKQTFEKLHQQGLTPAQIYDALIQNGLTEEELTPLAQYINANARVQGMQQATADAIEENVKSFVSDWSYHGTLNGQPMNGEQALYVQDSNGRTLLVGSGDVAFDQTTGRAKEGSGDMLVCLDPNTKELVYVKADEVTLFQNQPIDQFAAEYRQRLQMKNSEPYNQAAQEQAMQDAAKAQQEQEAANISENTVAEPRPQNEPKNEVSSENQDVKGGREPGVEEPRPQPQPTRKFADGTDVPMATDSKGRPTPDYASMTPEQSAEILTEDFGENAEKVVDGQIQKAEKALKDAEKMKVDYTAEPNDIMEQEALKNQTIEAAKKQLDHAQNIKKVMTAKKVAETVGSTEQTEGAHEAGSVAAQKFVNAPRLVGNKRTRMLADGETKIKGRYEIVPAESLTPSHDVNNGYKKSEGFPTDAEGRTVNDRDYEHDKAAQQNTDQIARKYNGMAIEQVPVVSDEGIVYDGNGRTMAGQKAAKEGTDGEYINDLLENAENFGFTREQIEQSGIEHPRLVLVTDERLPYDTATFSKFNRNEKKTQSNTEQAVAKAKSLTSDEVGAIVAEIEGNGSLDAFFNNSKAINDLVKTLVDKGIIGQNEVAQMMDSPERLSAQGREYVKNLLLGSIFKPETIRMLGIDSTVKNKAINAIRSVMDNMKLGEFSLRDEIDQAIQLLYEARQGGNKVDTLLRTSDMFGEDAAKRYPSISQMMALALEGKVADFWDLLDEYNRIAASRNTGEGSIFEAAPTKEELINEYLNFKKWQDYGTGHSETEGSHDVSGVEEPQQEASGGNEPERNDEWYNQSAVKVKTTKGEERKQILHEMGEYVKDYARKAGFDEPVVFDTWDDAEKEIPGIKEDVTGGITDEETALGGFAGEDKVYFIMEDEGVDNIKEVKSSFNHESTHVDNYKDPSRKEAIIASIKDFKTVKYTDLENAIEYVAHTDGYTKIAEKMLSNGEDPSEMLAEEFLANAVEEIYRSGENVVSEITANPTLQKLALDAYKFRENDRRGKERQSESGDSADGKVQTRNVLRTEKTSGTDVETVQGKPEVNAEGSNGNGGQSSENGRGEVGTLPLLPKEEKPDPTFDPIEAAAAEFKKEHPLTEEEIMKADVDDVVKDMALDYLNGDVTDDLHRAIYESIFAKTREQKTETKVETPKAEPSADPMEGIKNAAEGFEKEKKAKAETEKKPQQAADDAAVAASNKKVNDLWDMLKNAGNDELSASFVGLNSKQLELLPKLVGAMAENAYLRIKRGMHNLEDVVKEMRKEFAPAAKVFKKEDVDAIYEQMMNIRYRDGEQRMSLKEWADYYEKTSPKHQENLVGDSKSAEERKMSEKKFMDRVNTRLGFGQKINGIVELRKMAEECGLKDSKDTDLQELAEAAIVMRARGIASSESTNDAKKFELIKKLYENQPSLNQRDSERVMKGQFSTPAPYAFLADMYVKGNGKVIESALEPSAGNGMLTIGLSMDKVHVNDIDAQRLANLRRQGFKNVTSQDGTQPFADKNVDVVVTNPPFGSATPKEYDGYKISSLEGQMAINALESMKDDGRAAIIIGGKTEYAKNGSLNPKDKAFLGYLYSHYNVEDVINVDGSLFAKQGTTFPTRIILINGRRKYDPEHKVFPPVEKDARAETVKDYDELYKRIEDDILRSKEQPVDIRRKEKREGDKPSGRENVSDSTEENGGRGRLGTTRVPDGTSGNSEPSELDPSTRPVGQSEDADGRSVEAAGNGDNNTDGRGGQTSVPKSGPANGGSERGGNVPSGGNEPLRNGNGENGREPGVRHGTGHIQQPLEPAKKEEKKQSLTTEKVKYQPHSSAYSIGAVVPARQKEALDNVLDKLGDADQYLVDNLGYNDKEDLYAHLAAEQIDAVALGLKQMEKGNGFIIGDQTGIGKGRQAAAIIRYAVKQGRIPISFTQKANLFSDTYRDLNDIGSPELRPFILASSNEGNIKVNYDEEVKGPDGETATVRKQKVVYKVPSKTETERVLKYIAENGKLPEGYDYILTTYSQIRNGLEKFKGGKWKAKKKVTATDRNGQMKRDAIKRIAENSVFILDESHDAAGEGSGSAFIQDVLPKVKGVTFLSATYAKTPDAMKLYALKTDLGSKNKEEGEKGDASWKVLNAIKKGGAVFQEIMSQALTKSGQMIRRERDMTGVTIDWNPLTEDEVEIQGQRDKFDNIFGIFNDILNFQRTYVDAKLGQMSDDLAFIQGSADHTPGTKDMGIGNVTFASKAYNVVQQALFSIKAEKVADYAIEAIKNGEKPVIAVNNTMGSMIDEYPMGVEMDMPDLNSTLMKGLEGILRYTEKNDMGDQVNSTLRVEELGEEAVARYNEIKQKIASVSSGLSISPIDVIKHRLEEAGYKVGELTGRNTEMVYAENGKVIRKNRTDKNKNALADRFNNGDLDALILNRSAAAGISLHASSKYKDQRQRTMIFAQMQGNINDEVQIRGRIDRTGQVRRGKYVYLVSAIPAEQRLMMMFKNKLKSLDANTTSSQKSKFNEVDVQDFTNKYGDEIVLQYMAQHPEYYNKLADPLGWGFMEYARDGLSIGELKSGMKPNITSPAYEVMKRLTLLPVKEQEVVLKDISDSYSQKIKQLNDMGMNDLEMTDMPLEAKTLKREVWKEGSDPNGDNAFADNTYIETVEMNVLRKPMKAEEVEDAQKKMLDGKDYETWRNDKVAEIRAAQQAKIEDTKSKMAEQTEKKVAKVEESTRLALEKENAKIQKKLDKGEELKPGEHILTEEEIKTKVNVAVDDVKRRLSEKLSDAIKNVNVKYDMFVNPLFIFDPNKTISVSNDWYLEELSTSLYPEFGRVIGFKYDKNYSVGSSSIIIATTDSRKRVEIPLNRQKVFERIQKDSEMFSKECKVVNMDTWDRMIPKKDRTTGRIITGNMLEALADNSSIGHLISYTTDDGKVKQGILVPDSVSTAEITGNMPIAKAYDWFTKKTSGTELVSTDGALRLTKNFGSMYTLFVPASRKEGGKYYLNQDLLDLVHGRNFQSKGKNFWATFDAEKLKDVLNVLNGMGVEVKTPNDYSESGTHFRTDYGDRNYPTSSVESHIEKVAQKTGAKVKMVSSVDEITNKAAKAAIEDGRKITGWYDEKTGEVHLYMPNIHDRYTAEKTIWHEVVGHKGMRELFGDERFDKFLRDVWYDLDKPENAALKKLVDEERKYNPLNIYDAIEEGIARLAEDGKGEPGFWNGIKNKVSDFLHEIGYRIAPNTKDVKYLLWLGKNLQKNPNDPYWKMRAEAVKYRLDHERMPAVVAHDGMFYGNDGKVRSMESLTKSEWNEATDGQIHFRTTPSAGTALDRYHRSLDEHGYMFTESYMDNMLSLKKLMNAIVPDKKIEDITSSENPYILQNTMQGAMSDAAQMFERNVMKPLDKAMADVLDAFDGKKDDEKIRNFNLYMITKHGLERNREFFVRDFLKQMRMDEQKKQDADFLENSYYSDKEYLDNELKAGNIDLKEYYRQLDESIRNHFDADFEAGEHDYSGMHAIQEVAKSSDPYDDAEAIQSVMDSEAKMESIKKGSVKDYWNKVKAATQYSIDSDYKNGIISKELHGHVSNMFNWYVPLRKYDEATAEDTYGYITEQGDPKSYIGSTIMRARGHKYLSETNVLAQIGAMGNRAIKNGGMNAIRQAFARFARNNSGNNLITETSVWYEKDPVVNIVYERYPDIPEDATADEINQIVSDFNKDMKMKESQGLAYKVYRRDKIGYKFQRAENKSQHIVDVKIAGRTHTFIINGNPRAAQALNGLLENSGANGIMKPLSSISRMMAQLCTSYNPEFVMRNIMRDAEFASSNVTSKEGARYGALWAKYYAQLGLYKGASNISFKDLSGTTGLGLFAKYRNGTLDTYDKVQRYFKEFMENGGETGWVQIKNMQDWTKEYKKDVKSERSKIDKGGAALRDFFFGNLANINEVAENIARFATYCASRDSNRSIIRSVYDAKEVSTNFNRHGSGDAIKSFKNGEMTSGKAAARWAYGFTSSYLRHYSMFFNAGIQSTNLLVKNLKNHPVGTSINMLAIPFALGALAALGNNVLIASEDEKDRKGVKDPYGELPDYVRRNNLCIYKGGGEFVTIPLAIELRAFYGLGDLAAGLTFSPNVSGQKNPALDAVGCMSQLVPVMDYLGNSSAGKEPLNETIKAISPSALSPFVEWELNTDWKGAPIERRGDWNENSPAWQRAYKGVPDGYMAVNKWVNAQTNDVAKGNEDMLGNSFLDMVTNPSMLNHYIGGIGGGAATFTERLIGVIKHGSDTETKDIPFLRSLLYTPNEQSSLQRTKSKWYNYKDEMEKTMANVNRLKSKNVPLDKRITNIGEYYQFQNSKEAAKVRVIELAEKQMKRWKKMRDKASDTESINFANQNIDRIMMDAVDELDRLE